MRMMGSDPFNLSARCTLVLNLVLSAMRGSEPRSSKTHTATLIDSPFSARLCVHMAHNRNWLIDSTSLSYTDCRMHVARLEVVR